MTQRRTKHPHPCPSWHDRREQAHVPRSMGPLRTKSGAEHTASQTPDASTHCASSFLASRGHKGPSCWRLHTPPSSHVSIDWVSERVTLERHTSYPSRAWKPFSESSIRFEPRFRQPSVIVSQLRWLCSLSCPCLHLVSFAHYLAVILETPCTESSLSNAPPSQTFLPR